ncbi:hypothetical protein AB1L08_16225 [Siminovitchia sp. 179-K 8D1 HS]
MGIVAAGQDISRYYKDFKNGMVSPHTEKYKHKMPGGQYSNLEQQAKAVGLGDYQVIKFH